MTKKKLPVKKKIDTLTHHTESLQQQIKSMEERINQQKDYSRRNNIRISGVAEPESGETLEQTAVMVSSLLADKLELPGVELERAHRVGQHRDDRPRPIVTRFSRYCDREAAMRNTRKIRGTNINFNDDLCAASQSIKNAQMPQLKQARAEAKMTYFTYTKLIMKGRLITQKPSVNVAPSNLDREQQDMDEATLRNRELLDATTRTVAEDGAAVDGADAQGGDGLERTSAVHISSTAQAFPPLPPPTGCVGLPGAASLPHSEEVRKYPKRNARKK